MHTELRAGDIVRVSCPFTPARVTGKSREHVRVAWPWWSADPDCDWIEWNGEVALLGDPASYEWERELFRTDPTGEHLTVGADCMVGIPPTLVYVLAVDHFAPPRETGRLPRPRRQVVMLRAGQPYDAELEQQGYEIDPDDDIPISLDLRFRPYACLATGDEVADAAGRAWRFTGPWDWHPFDGREPHEPVWPLTLLTRRGHTGDGAAAAAVTAATNVGSHEQELARWAELARVSPPGPRL